MEPILTLTGPTAAGKTEMSIALAKHLSAEIISADSRQVFIELNVGTAKPDPEDLEQVPHHFVNELHLGTSFSAGIFERNANKRIKEILERGNVPIVVGGSMMYIHALQYGLADVPQIAPEIRIKIKSRLEEDGADILFNELKQIDPISAQSMDATKTQRLVRALEVYHGTGKPLSSFFEQKTIPPYSYRTFVLTRDRKYLYRRIEKRVEEMIENGLVEEVGHLLSSGFSSDLNPLRTIGYQEPILFLRGEINRDEMIRLIIRNTRRYAKRQLTWFRRYAEYNWVDVEDDGNNFNFLLQ